MHKYKYSHTILYGLRSIFTFKQFDHTLRPPPLQTIRASPFRSPFSSSSLKCTIRLVPLSKHRILWRKNDVIRVIRDHVFRDPILQELFQLVHMTRISGVFRVIQPAIIDHQLSIINEISERRILMCL
jgi:hypothetical protein